MATAMLKTTYSLDLQTAATLEKLAQTWKTSKSDVIRRLAKDASEKLPLETPPSAEKPKYSADNPINEDAARRVAALRAMAESMKARGVDYEEWKRTIWESRR